MALTPLKFKTVKNPLASRSPTAHFSTSGRDLRSLHSRNLRSLHGKFLLLQISRLSFLLRLERFSNDEELHSLRWSHPPDSQSPVFPHALRLGPPRYSLLSLCDVVSSPQPDRRAMYQSHQREEGMPDEYDRVHKRQLKNPYRGQGDSYKLLERARIFNLLQSERADYEG